MSTPTQTMYFDCPICEASDVHTVNVKIYPGCDASCHGPAEPDTFDFDTPETCPRCGAEYTDDERDELERTIEQTISDEVMFRSYQTTYVGRAA